MGKLVLFLIVSAFMQVALFLFASSGSGGYESGTLIGNDNSSTALTSLFTNPSDLANNPLFSLILSSFGQVVAISLFVGSLLFRNERFLFIGMAFVFLSFIFPIVNMWSFLAAQGFAGPISFFICSLFMAPIIMMAIGVVIDFAQGKD